MSTVRDEYTNIVGVDTHARTNTYAILAAISGHVVDTAMFPTSPPGLKRAIDWIDRRSEPGKTLVAIDGTNSYGSGPTRALRATNLDICEVRLPRRTSRAGHGKSDDIDALAAARTVLGEQVSALLDPRAEGNREALRILLNARDVMEHQGTADRLILTSLMRTMDLGVVARTALTDEQVLQISKWRAHLDDDLQTRIARTEAKRLGGANPIPASSGHNVRHRLNRNGDRQLNRALHTIARSRMMFNAATKSYVERRTAEGKGIKENRRCLKRFITRQLFRKLQTLLT